MSSRMARSSKQGLPIRFSNYSIIDDSNQIKVNRLYNFFNQTGDTEFTPLVDQQFHVEGLDGIVNQGELLLIIGPPSSNTNILLRSLSAPNDLQRSDSSHLDYGLLPPSMVTRPTFRLGKSNDQHGRLRSEIVFLSEHDVHFPHLSVEASLMPGSVAKVPSARSRDDKLSRREWAKVQLTALLKSTGLSHAVKTKMGSGSVQGLVR
jgi:ABC-type polar amino acid transport system ATPase subunit